MSRIVLIYTRSSPGCALSAEEQEVAARQVALTEGYTVGPRYREPPLTRRGQRDGLRARDALLADAIRSHVAAVAVSSLERLGRDLPDLVATLARLNAAGILLLVGTAGGTSTSSVASLDAARRSYHADAAAEGRRLARERGVRFGRAPIDEQRLQRVRLLLNEGTGVRATARRVGVSPATVIRVRNGYLPRQGEPAAQAAMSSVSARSSPSTSSTGSPSAA